MGNINKDIEIIQKKRKKTKVNSGFGKYKNWKEKFIKGHNSIKENEEILGGYGMPLDDSAYT